MPAQQLCGFVATHFSIKKSKIQVTGMFNSFLPVDCPKYIFTYLRQILSSNHSNQAGTIRVSGTLLVHFSKGTDLFLIQFVII